MKKQYKKMQDMELLPLIEQDEEAFNEIYRRYYKLVYFIAYEMCQNDADAKDVLQETFIKVRSAAKNVRDENKFKFWLNAVTISKCKDLFKKNRYKTTQENHAQNMQAEERRYMLPEKQMHFETDKELLHHFIARLPQNQREVLVLKYFSHLSLQEIAEMMHISEGTVKSRLHYAKDSLRGMIEGYNGKETNQPLDFESMDPLLPAVFMYAYHCRKYPQIGWMLKFRSHVGDHAWMAGSVAIAVSVALAGGCLIYDQMRDRAKEQESILRSEYNPAYRRAYFELLDFAANPYDMEAKSAEQLNSVYDDYRLLKEADNAYYRLLLDQHWVAMYEEALQKKR